MFPCATSEVKYNKYSGDLIFNTQLLSFFGYHIYNEKLKIILKINKKPFPNQTYNYTLRLQNLH